LQHGTTSLRSRGWWRRRRSRRRRKRREESLDSDPEGGKCLRSRSPAVTYLAGTHRHRLVSGVMEDAKQKEGGSANRNDGSDMDASLAFVLESSSESGNEERQQAQQL
jgi:hypothetical protein